MRLEEQRLLNTIRLTLWSVSLLLLFMLMLVLLLFIPNHPETVIEAQTKVEPASWTPPDSTKIPNTAEGEMIRYGYELIAHTSVYLGPSGKITAISNGMNCQNCHLKAGRKVWGNNYAAVASTYPKFRFRSGTIESIERRVNDCLERSLNGSALKEDSREMKAMVQYIRWVGSSIAKDVIPLGSGIFEVPVMERAANPELGMRIYQKQCSRCHGIMGQGARNGSGTEWRYPPLWGDSSFNSGAGLLRISRMAGFIFRNMPNDAATQLSETEAWDVAAYICSQPRPGMDISRDWPDIKSKPFDHPFGPYADPYSEQQHKLGPFGPILTAGKPR